VSKSLSGRRVEDSDSECEDADFTEPMGVGSEDEGHMEDVCRPVGEDDLSTSSGGDVDLELVSRRLQTEKHD
jgi:hypothetical protein